MENWTLTWTKLVKLDGGLVQALDDDMPGVYRLSYHADDGSYYVFYVGQAEDIKSRLLQHLSSSEENVGIKNFLATKDCYFRYAKVTKPYIREAAERQMYNHYEPACNNVEPSGRDDVRVNLS